MALAVPHHLHLDVAEEFDELLQNEGGVAEIVLGLEPRLGEGRGHFFRATNDLLSPPPAARAGFEKDRIADFLGGLDRFFGGPQKPCPRHGRYV